VSRRGIAAKITAYTYAFLITGCWVVLKVASRRCEHEPESTELGNMHPTSWKGKSRLLFVKRHPAKAPANLP